MRKKVLGFLFALALAYGIDAVSSRRHGKGEVQASGEAPADVYDDRYKQARAALLARMVERGQGEAFRQAVALVREAVGGSRPIPLFGPDAPGTGYAFSVEESQKEPEWRSYRQWRSTREKLRSSLKWKVREKGAILLFHGWRELAVLATGDPLDVVLYMELGPDTVEVDGRTLTPLDVSEELRKIKQEYPFEITGFSKVSLQGKFMARVKDVPALAKRLHRLCAQTYPGSLEWGLRYDQRLSLSWR